MTPIHTARSTYTAAAARKPLLLALLALVALAVYAPVAPVAAQAGLAAAPAVVYSSYLGGDSDEEAKGIARDKDGNIYVLGDTYSSDFAGSPSPIAGSTDIFVAKFDPTGKRLLYRTIIGGKDSEYAKGIAVNAAGEVAVTATTSSLDFPLVKPLLAELPDYNGALFKLNAAGQVAFSTFLNISFGYSTQNIAFDKAGNMVLTGMLWTEFNTGREDVVVAIIKGDGSAAVRVATFGGDWVDRGHALAIGPNGNIYIAGMTHEREGGFPLDGSSFQSTCGAKAFGADRAYCDEDAFVTVLDPTGTDVLYSTYLGGAGTETVYGLGVDAAGNAYVAGTTGSQNFPTKSAFQPKWLGADNFSNGFITKLTPDLSAQLYSTYVASQDQYSSDYIHAMTVDAAGNASITGLTNGKYFPVKDAFQRELDGTVCLASSERYCHDAFVATFTPSGALAFGSYLGAYDDDSGYAIAGDGKGGLWVAGKTEANDFIVTGDAAQPESMMQSDAFLTHVGTASAPTTPTPPANLSYRAYLPLLQR